MLVARALKNSQLTCGERHAYFWDRTLADPDSSVTVRDANGKIEYLG
jgi:hypothetical protein